jgi:DNA-binding PadR family transcriptional regulator
MKDVKGFSIVDSTYNDGNNIYKLTDKGIKNIERYISELKAKRKEILDAGLDTADETNIPTVSDIFIDAIDLGFDEYGEAFNGWGVTDNYDADYPIFLKLGEDIEQIK